MALRYLGDCPSLPVGCSRRVEEVASDAPARVSSWDLRRMRNA
jgi:hypothetical protein